MDFCGGLLVEASFPDPFADFGFSGALFALWACMGVVLESGKLRTQKQAVTSKIAFHRTTELSIRTSCALQNLLLLFQVVIVHIMGNEDYGNRQYV